MLERITKIAAKYYHISYEDVFSSSRLREYVQARQMICYVARIHYKMPLQKIATFINKNHATVLHSVNVVANEISISKEKRKEYDEIKHDIFHINAERVYTNPDTSVFCHPVTYGTAV